MKHKIGLAPTSACGTGDMCDSPDGLRGASLGGRGEGVRHIHSRLGGTLRITLSVDVCREIAVSLHLAPAGSRRVGEGRWRRYRMALELNYFSRPTLAILKDNSHLLLSVPPVAGYSSTKLLPRAPEVRPELAQKRVGVESARSRAASRSSGADWS